MPIKIDFVSNVRDLLRGTKSVEDSFDDVADSLDDVARDGDQSLGRLERSFRDVVRDAEKTDKAIEKIGDSGGKGFGKAKAAAGEFKQEAIANVSEVTSSFSGSMSSIGDLAQGTLGGLATSGIPAVGAAAAVAAVGVGLITAEINKQAEDAKKLRDRLAGAYQEAAEQGRAYLDVSQLVGEANDLMFNADRAEEYKKLKQDAKTLLLDESLLIRANAGDLEAQAIVEREINGYLESRASKVAGQYGTYTNLSKAAQELKDRWKGITEATKTQAEAAENSKAVTSELLRQAIKDAGTATVEVNKLGDELYTLGDGTTIVIDAETGQATKDVQDFGETVKTNTGVKTAKIRVEIDDRTSHDISQIVRGINGTVAKIRVGTRREAV